MPSSRRARRWVVLGALLCVLLGAAGIAAVRELRGPSEVTNPDVEFAEEQAPETAPEKRRKPTRRTGHPMDDGFAWPVYGYTKARTKYLPLRRPLRPPFVKLWTVRGPQVLLEFPPVSCRRRLYLLKDNGALYAISRLTGRVIWKRKLGRLAASSPACGPGSVYATILERGRGIDAGRVVALAAADGRTRWSRKLPSRSESSPLLDRDRVIFGTEDGTVYSLRASDGAVRWRYRAAGAVKGGLALADGKLFFGDYGSRVHAIRRADGRRVWTSAATGRVYATPAVAYGRVFLGTVDGAVASYSTRDGRLAWRTPTGGYVYSSPAVAPVDGVGPTVFAGSYDHRLYAFDARSGRVRWRRDVGDRISGAPVVVGDLVFYSSTRKKRSGALGAATGRPVWRIDKGAYNPVISDEKRLYLVGATRLFMLTTPAQARRDRRAIRRLKAQERRAMPPEMRRRRRAQRQRARRRAAAARRQRAIDRRVAARRRRVRENLRRRRLGIEVCFRAKGRQVCRIPRELVCFRPEGEQRTVCRPRRRGARRG